MKTKRFFSAFFLMLLAADLNGQEFSPITPTMFPACRRVQAADIGKITGNYGAALETNNEGIVASALTQLAYIRLCRPDCAFSSIRTKVDSLTIFGATPSIRYKAFLTGLVFSAPETFGDTASWESLSTEELFPTLASRMRLTIVSHVSTGR